MTHFEKRLRLAVRVTDELLRRFGDAVHAVGMHGSMAHQDVDARSDIDLVVVADIDDAIPDRWVDDVFVSLSITAKDSYLKRAGEIGSWWSVSSDEFVTIRVLHDPAGFFDLLRRTQEKAVASATDLTFLRAARDALVEAMEWLGKGERCVERESAPGAFVCLTGALVALALSVGLLSRTRWRGEHQAVGEAAAAGRVVEGFSDPYLAALDEKRSITERIARAHAAVHAVRAYLARKRVSVEVGTIAQLLAGKT